MARLYADAPTLAAYPGGDAVPAEDADTALRMASRVVDQLLRGRVYDVDAARMPTDPGDAEAMADATCAIAVALHAGGVLSGGGGELEWDSVSIGNVSLSGRSSSPSGQLQVLGVTIPAAAQIALADVGRLVVIAR